MNRTVFRLSACALLASLLGLSACTSTLEGTPGPGSDAGTTDMASPTMDGSVANDGNVDRDANVPAMDATLDAMPNDDMSTTPLDSGTDGMLPLPDASVGVPGRAPPTELCATSGCTNFYVSSSTGSDSNSGTSPDQAWATLDKVYSARASIHAGDTVLFKRGDHFMGPFRWRTSGTEGHPITFGNYGDGDLPLFELAPGSAVPLENRDLFYFENTSYIVVDGFNVTDLNIAMDPVRLADHDMFAYVGTAIRFDAYDYSMPIQGSVVKNCDISLTGMGVVFLGTSHSSLENNRITNLKNLVNTCGDPGTYMSYEDYGANGFTLNGSDNFVIGNYFEGNYASSCDFGFNGGAIELYGDVNRNQVLYNTFVDNGGVAEFGSADMNGMADNLFAYNLMINNGAMSWCNISGPFASMVSNVQYFNNTIIDTGNRFTDVFLFGFNGSPEAATIFNLKNNIFYLSDGLDIVSSHADASKYIHENNIYVLSGGSAVNYTLGSSELMTSSAVFTSASGLDPTTWNYVPPAASPPVGAGQPLGFTRDHDGTSVASPPDVGAYQRP